MLPFSPGRLLQPEPVMDASDSFPCSCWNKKTDLSSVTTVHVQENGVIFCDLEGLPLFQKSFRFLSKSFWEFDDDMSPEDTLRFPVVPRVLGDIAVRVTFQSPACRDTLVEKLQQYCPPDKRDLAIATTIHILECGVAKRLPNHDHLHEIIDSTLTELAFSPASSILAPIYDWKVTHDDLELHRIRTQVKDFFLSNPPPIVVLVESNESLPRTEINVSNAMAPLPFCAALLPHTPTWPLTTIPPPRDEWLQSILNNYGVHQRHRDGNPNSKTIFLSMELYRWYIAALTAAQNSPSPEATHSLLAATASIKATVIHETGHFWVAHEPTGDSPAHASAKDADIAQFDVAENDDMEPDMIEAGNLIDTVWLGGPHRLVISSSE
ncbi:hypothetical protein B0H16DRAFT_1756216 [Mycena metata]|uniref:Uncharacterized protein n=1 Tax=Mycena metata TaxID=1033252 RepID=A0AAD7P3G0_9AGAR|nr:hypothetical protein B0H16DRAFT_1756216 [Mycena metata]